MKFNSNLIFHHRSCSNCFLCRLRASHQSMIVLIDFHTVNQDQFAEITDISIISNEMVLIVFGTILYDCLFKRFLDFEQYNLWLEFLCFLFFFFFLFGVNWMDIYSSFYAVRWAFMMNKLWSMNSSNVNSIHRTLFQ